MTTMHLNLGCGNAMIAGSGWLNIDSRKLRPTDGAAFKRLNMLNIRDYIKSGSVKTVLLRDSLEHVTKPEAEQLLAACADVLAPGGKLEIKTPAIHLLLKWADANDEMTAAIYFYGNQDYPENVHRFCWPVGELKKQIRTLGLEIESVTECEKTNVVIVAVKHGDHHA